MFGRQNLSLNLSFKTTQVLQRLQHQLAGCFQQQILMPRHALVYGGLLRDDILSQELKRPDIIPQDIDLIVSESVFKTGMFDGIWERSDGKERQNSWSMPGESYWDEDGSTFCRNDTHFEGLRFFQAPQIETPINLIIMKGNVPFISPQTLAAQADLGLCGIVWDGTQLVTSKAFRRDLQEKVFRLQPDNKCPKHELLRSFERAKRLSERLKLGLELPAYA